VGGIEPDRAEAIAKALMSAENPVAFAAYLGRKGEAVAVLDRLARTCGIRVVEFNAIDLNIPQDSPCYAGGDPLALLESADLGLLLDTDVPFVPQSKRAREMKWIQIDIDPLKADFPMWGFATDMRVQGDSSVILQQVLDAVEARADDAFRKRIVARIESWSGAREASARRRADTSANKGVSGALSTPFVFKTLSDKISQDDVVLNEAIRNGPILQEHLKRTKPQSYVGLAGGGLGFSGGMALGLKLAQPKRRVVQVIGDGGFHFSSPDSVYATAQQYQIPILTVVLDNGGWQAVKSATQRVYPKGIAAETDQFQSRLMSGRQGERRDFSEVAKAFGAYGECVREPDELAAAIDRCLAALDDGKAAVLHVHVTRL
jgi:acetolactate synthase-1/2/3 large subunit